MKKKHPHFGIYFLALVSGVAIGVISLCLVLAGDIYEYQDTVDGVHLPRVDAIVVLAGGRGRIAAAGDIWYRYWELGRSIILEAGENPVPQNPPVLYVSGMGHSANWSVFTHQIRRGVKSVIQRENVVLETESENTDANAKWLARYGYERNWEKILLITSGYHMKRARHIFEHVLKFQAPSKSKAIMVETFSIYQDPLDSDDWRADIHGIKITLLEYFKWVYYRYGWRPSAGN